MHPISSHAWIIYIVFSFFFISFFVIYYHYYRLIGSYSMILLVKPRIMCIEWVVPRAGMFQSNCPVKLPNQTPRSFHPVLYFSTHPLIVNYLAHPLSFLLSFTTMFPYNYRGRVGSALLFLLPSEAPYVQLLYSHNLSPEPLSLQSLFLDASKHVPGMCIEQFLLYQSSIDIIAINL